MSNGGDYNQQNNFLQTPTHLGEQRFTENKVPTRETLCLPLVNKRPLHVGGVNDEEKG